MTTDSIEGYEIDRYCGLVSGVSFYMVGGAFGEGSFGNKPTKLYQQALDEAMTAMKKNAGQMSPIPDAVVGIKTNVLLAPTIGTQVILTGTAVTFKK